MRRQKRVDAHILVKPAVHAAAHHAVVPMAGDFFKVPEGGRQNIRIDLLGPDNAAPLQVAVRVVAAHAHIQAVGHDQNDLNFA